MRKQLLLIGLFLFAGLAFHSCSPSDAELQTAVSTALKAVSAPVSCSVSKGVVTLSGVVESAALKATAESLATAVKGVKSVTNSIEVKVPEPPKPVINPDDVLTTSISAAISAAGTAFSKVKVAVKDGEVTLTGDIKRADLQKLMQIANETKPKKVINQLNILK
ncbi:MAG: BON domain-containing protein [Bacteroidales bacterium]|jgi:osmotically-inducible protein OsmY|nr:BON domain-containing protein [Bacteroidales bacterium]